MGDEYGRCAPVRGLGVWHCYTVKPHGLGVLTADVEASTAERAAELAATQHGYPGGWTVIPGQAVRVSVSSVTTYTAKRV
jgi:hypothetical protein